MEGLDEARDEGLFEGDLGVALDADNVAVDDDLLEDLLPAAALLVVLTFLADDVDFLF